MCNVRYVIERSTVHWFAVSLKCDVSSSSVVLNVSCTATLKHRICLDKDHLARCGRRLQTNCKGGLQQAWGLEFEIAELVMADFRK